MHIHIYIHKFTTSEQGFSHMHWHPPTQMVTNHAYEGWYRHAFTDAYEHAYEGLIQTRIRGLIRARLHRCIHTPTEGYIQPEEVACYFRRIARQTYIRTDYYPQNHDLRTGEYSHALAPAHKQHKLHTNRGILNIYISGDNKCVLDRKRPFSKSISKYPPYVAENEIIIEWRHDPPIHYIYIPYSVLLSCS